jgi:hypothetical protein
MRPALPLLFLIAGCSDPPARDVTDATLAPGPVRVATPLAATPPASLPRAFFPPGTFPQVVEQLVSDWYGTQLVAMNEPSLWDAAVRGETAYRFLWLRTWGRPIAVRVTFDGTNARLVATRLTGDGDYVPGAVDVHRERELAKADVRRIEAALSAASFDTIDTENRGGCDGARWVIERAKDGAYRLVERWAPLNKAEYAAFVHACDLFLDLAGRDLVTGDVY